MIIEHYVEKKKLLQLYKKSIKCHNFKADCIHYLKSNNGGLRIYQKRDFIVEINSKYFYSLLQKCTIDDIFDIIKKNICICFKDYILSRQRYNESVLFSYVIGKGFYALRIIPIV